MKSLSYYFAKFAKNYLRPKAIADSKIDKKAFVCSGTSLLDVELDSYSYIGHDCTVNNCSIGKYCSIGSSCVIGGSEHPISWVSTSPVFHTAKNVLKESWSSKRFSVRKHTSIGNDVWIGTKVLIKSGVSIGNGAIVGMGSVVVKDIPEYEIWAGNPARFIRKRFDDDTIDKLSRLEWWNMDSEKLREIGDSISDPKEFIERVYQQKT